ncbi:nucleoside hydrolase [Natronorarus salvus]|uniref:nucleoside hydrolase n=1 Tax=Natronorarus salvus TaxID=3117733 RepID=UPI002F2618BC
MTADRRLLVDTDTASDDAIALLLAAGSEGAGIEGVTICAGNAPFDQQVENAKYTLDLAGADVPVHEGARTPLLKEHEYANDVHGESGLGELTPETEIASADEYAVDYIVRSARENPGEFTLVCLAPLTNVALALAREPDLPDLLEEVWIMGGAAFAPGNVTPAAEFNFWADPDAARMVCSRVEHTLVDWGVCVRDGTVDAGFFERVRDLDTPLAHFFCDALARVRAFNAETDDVDRATIPDALTVACLLDPDLVVHSTEVGVSVDEREGLTRGALVVDELGRTFEPRTELIREADTEEFERTILDTLGGAR